LPGLLTSEVPGLLGAIAELPRSDCASLAATSRSVKMAMEPIRRQARDLYECAAAGDAGGVRRLLASGAPVDWAFDREVGSGNGRDTALTAAVRNVHPGIVELLVDSPRFDPADQASVDALDMAIDRYKGLYRDADRPQARRQRHIVKSLLSHGVSITGLPDHRLALCWKLVFTWMTDAIPHVLWNAPPEKRSDLAIFMDGQSLVSAGAVLAIPDRQGRTFLHWCAAHVEPREYPDVWRYLDRVTGGAMPEVLDNHRRSPLHYAASSGRSDAVRCLLDGGLDPNGFDASGKTPLDDAFANRNFAGAGLLMTHPEQG
jgi:hypothetical protein